MNSYEVSWILTLVQIFISLNYEIHSKSYVRIKSRSLAMCFISLSITSLTIQLLKKNVKVPNTKIKS